MILLMPRTPRSGERFRERTFHFGSRLQSCRNLTATVVIYTFLHQGALTKGCQLPGLVTMEMTVTPHRHAQLKPRIKTAGSQDQRGLNSEVVLILRWS